MNCDMLFERTDLKNIRCVVNSGQYIRHNFLPAYPTVASMIR